MSEKSPEILALHMATISVHPTNQVSSFRVTKYMYCNHKYMYCNHNFHRPILKNPLLLHAHIGMVKWSVLQFENQKALTRSETPFSMSVNTYLQVSCPVSAGSCDNTWSIGWRFLTTGGICSTSSAFFSAFFMRCKERWRFFI